MNLLPLLFAICDIHLLIAFCLLSFIIDISYQILAFAICHLPSVTHHFYLNFVHLLSVIFSSIFAICLPHFSLQLPTFHLPVPFPHLPSGHHHLPFALRHLPFTASSSSMPSAIRHPTFVWPPLLNPRHHDYSSLSRPDLFFATSNHSIWKSSPFNHLPLLVTASPSAFTSPRYYTPLQLSDSYLLRNDTSHSDILSVT